MSTQRKLTMLVRVTRASILMIERFVEAFNPQTDCEKVPFRIQRLDELFKRHTAAFVDLELSTDDVETLEEYAKERVDMEERYSKLRDFLVSHKPAELRPAFALCSPPDPISSSCSVCYRSHRTAVCVQFLRLPYDQKLETVLRKNLCRNCLSASHHTRDCPSRSCWRCQQKHHLSLHPPSPDELPFPTRIQTTTDKQPSDSTLPSSTLTRTQALALTSTPKSNNPQSAVSCEAQLVSQGSNLISKAQLRYSLRCGPLFAGGSPREWLFRVQYKAETLLPETRRYELEVLCPAGVFDQQLTPVPKKLEDSQLTMETVLPAGTVNTLLHSCSLESEEIRFKHPVTLKHGSLEDTTAAPMMNAHAMVAGVIHPKFDKLKFSLPGRNMSQTRLPRSGFPKFCKLEQPGAPPTSSSHLTTEDLSQTWNVKQAQSSLKVQSLIRNGKMVELRKFWHVVDTLVDRGALPVGGRRCQPTKLILVANRSPRKLTLCSAHCLLLNAGPPFEIKFRNMARKQFDTNRRGRPPDVNLKISLSPRISGSKANVDDATRLGLCSSLPGTNHLDWVPANLSDHCSTRLESQCVTKLDHTQQASKPTGRASEIATQRHVETDPDMALQAHWIQPHSGDQPSCSNRQQGQEGRPEADELLNDSAATPFSKEEQ